MHILHLITRLDAGGSATNTIRSCVGQAETLGGENVLLAAGPSPDVDHAEARALQEAGVRLYSLPHMQREPSPFRDVWALTETVALIRKVRPDVLHTHCSKAGVLGRLAGRMVRVPAVVHTPHGHVFSGYFGPLRTWLYTVIERRAARWCDRIVSLTDLETREYLARRIGKPEQYVTIPSGVPLERFRSVPEDARARIRRSLNVQEETIVFLSVGRLEPVKGFDLLISAWALLPPPPPRLWIAGEGPMRASLEKQADEAGLLVHDQVRFLGFRRDIPELMHAADAFVLASRNEGMGRVLVEAMAAGLPVLATAVGGIPALIDDGKTGLLAAPGNPAAIAAGVQRLAGDPELRRALAQAGSRRVWPDFDEATMVAKLLALYNDVLGEKTG